MLSSAYASIIASDSNFFSADIKDAEGMGFAGTAPKSMSKSCDKDGSCEEPENVWDYLPEKEVSFAHKAEHAHVQREHCYMHVQMMHATEARNHSVT